MKKLLGYLFSALVLAGFYTVPAYAEGLGAINSDTYVVMDAKTGQVLLQQNMHKQKYPASITKVFTAALALDGGNVSDTVEMNDDAVFSVPRDTTHISLTPGEIVTVEDLLYGTMLESANDAANGLALYKSGSVEEFVQLMNQKAKELGASNTNFVNTNGIHNSSHKTTAYDMALLTKYAMGVPGFDTYYGAIEYTIQPTNKQSVARNLGTYHHMIVNSAYEYDGAWGGKLGWTPEANHTLVTTATRGDMELICVVMDTVTKFEKYEDTAALFDYCFENFEVLTVSQRELDLQPVVVQNRGVEQLIEFVDSANLYLTVPKGTSLEDLKTSFNIPVIAEAEEDLTPQVTFATGNGDVLTTVALAYEFGSVLPGPGTEVWGDPADLIPIVKEVNVAGVIAVIFGGFFVVLVLLFLRERRIQQQMRRRMRRKYGNR